MPTPSSVHVNAALTNVAIKYKNMAYVAERIFPVVNVVKESDVYYVFRKEGLVTEDALRAAGAEAREIEWDVDQATYTAQEYALRHLVTDRVMNNADTAIRPKITATQKLTDKLLLGWERRLALLVQNQANLVSGSAATPAIKWDGTSPTIESNIDTAKNTVRIACGTEPTSIVIPYAVMLAIKRDTTVRDLIRYTVPNGELLRNGDLPPVIWNLETIIAGTVRNSANEGATATLVDVWTDNVLVFYKEATPSLDALSLGYTFRVNQFTTKSYREEKRGGDMVEVSHIQTERVVANDAGYLITDVLS